MLLLTSDTETESDLIVTFPRRAIQASGHSYKFNKLAYKRVGVTVVAVSRLAFLMISSVGLQVPFLVHMWKNKIA